MVKNWIELGDKAFESKDRPIGVIRFSNEEMNNWQMIGWKRFADAVNNNDMVRELVFKSNCVRLFGLFNRKTGVELKHIRAFADSIAKVCNNIEYGHVKIQYVRRKVTNLLVLYFWNYFPDVVDNSKPFSCIYICGKELIQIQFKNGDLFS